ncbi:hypothetical protein ACQP0C_18480 [Nocardia sp. CA-129566]|uniref:hypothetical protein n=1 Tax=Nocardia sp. CA-129566 TaxID=3239976 RepID=UPI003D96E7C0
MSAGAMIAGNPAAPPVMLIHGPNEYPKLISVHFSRTTAARPDPLLVPCGSSRSEWRTE